MALVLGIHVGHHSACAVVKDGALVAAAQLERSSRIKHHAVLGLGNELNVGVVLRAAGATMADVDLVVSSFQATAPGGFGLDRPLIEADFSLFDPWADRHWVVSHHLAHSHSTFDASGFDDAAVIICDYAGSGTLDGNDYALRFADWHRHLTSQRAPVAPRVECLSIYEAARAADHRVLHREYNVSHQGRASFVYSVASLYENVTRYVMGTANAHGQLMALAAYGKPHEGAPYDPGPLVEIAADHQVVFRNDWQHAVPRQPSFEQQACFAWRCQEATEAAVLAHARRARELTASNNLAVAGGVFLNILSNTRLAAHGPFARFHVPSAPHDAGIAVGCAFFGARKLGGRCHAVRTDRLGPSYPDEAVEAALAACEPRITRTRYRDDDVVAALCANQIVARWNGRAELGPRALGGRSLLGSPLAAGIRDRMNQIKGRQAWRPVAPVIPHDQIARFFTGPIDSWWMTMSHQIPSEHQAALAALAHPDGSTRSQTLLEHQDEELYRWLQAFGERTGYPILVNTSLNRGGEPIVETPANALELFLDRPDIDMLLVGPWMVMRRAPPPALAHERVGLADHAILTTMFRGQARIHNLTNGVRSWRISGAMFRMLDNLGATALALAEILAPLDDTDRAQVQELLHHGVLHR